MILARSNFMARRTLQRNGWHIGHILIAMSLIGIAVLVTSDAWDDLLHIAARDEESSQIWLVPIAVVWLAWVRRGRLGYCRPRGFWIGAAIAAVGAGIYLTGKLFLIELFWHGGAVILAAGCFITAMGRDILRSFFVVFFALLFLIPIPGRVRQAIALPLESTTAMVTQRVCELLGMEVDQSGNLLRIPDNASGVASTPSDDVAAPAQTDPGYIDVTVGEACNGMRLIFALLLVSFVVVFVTPLRTYVRVLLAVLSPVLALICNVIRLVPTVWIYGHYSRPAADRFHDATGWMMLVVAFVLLLGIIRLLRWTMLPAMAFNLALD